ncbi:MAG: hypothetical protein IPM92_07915 [Saprospiraceae bacterium]|nr:hypothetical protein [Saprospiraceae bacterium]
MKRGILLLYASIGVLSVVAACDKCACNMSGPSGGISDLVYKNGMSLQYASAYYKSNHMGKSTDVFHTCLLAGNYYLNENLKFNAQIPYQLNTRNSEVGNSQNQGFGDARVMLHAILMKARDLGKGYLAEAQVGLGFKLPTGKYLTDLHASNLPENFNTGNGAFGINAQASVAISKDQMGIYLGSYYLQYLKSKDDYHFGNQLSLSSLFFVIKEWSNGFALTPQTGFSWEHSWNDRGVNGFQIENTGGWGLLWPIGLSIRKDALLLNLQYSIPLEQNYAGGDSQLRNKMAIDLHYFF